MEKEEKRKTLEIFARLPPSVRKGIAAGKALADAECAAKLESDARGLDEAKERR